MRNEGVERVRVIDSHTGGEPTRVVIEGGPDLGGGSVARQLEQLRDRCDWFRSAVVNESRGFEALVGALLCPSERPDAVTGVIFFNNVGYLGMCGHGLIGVMITLAYLRRIRPGSHVLETPVGTVRAELDDGGRVTVQNVASYRLTAGVVVDVEGHGAIRGDVAWGGNWFFLSENHGPEIAAANIERLTELSRRIRRALERGRITGEAGAEIDHIELFGPPARPDADSKNFILCPGGAYDRSPCGTGTSAKPACLAAEGRLEEGRLWRQESIIGSLFEAWYERRGDLIIPFIRGTAHVHTEATFILDPRDPFCFGIRR